MRELIVPVTFRSTCRSYLKRERNSVIKPLFFLENCAYVAAIKQRPVPVSRSNIRGRRIAAELQLISGKPALISTRNRRRHYRHMSRRKLHEPATSASFWLARVVDRSYSEI